MGIIWQMHLGLFTYTVIYLALILVHRTENFAYTISKLSLTDLIKLVLQGYV